MNEQAVDAATDAPRPDEPALSRRDAWRARAKEVHDYIDPILKTLLVVTVLLGGYEYLHRQQADRVQKSLDLVDEWKSAGHRDAYGRLNDAVWPLYQEALPALQAMAGDPARVQKVFANIGDTATGRDDSFSSTEDHDVDEIFYFFESAALCANERICDYDVLHAFLGEEVTNFWRYFSEYAERRQRLRYANYGYWTERFARGDINRSWFGLL